MNEIHNIYQLLNFNYNQNLTNKHTKIVITPPMLLVTEDEFNHYSPQIQNLYTRIFAFVYDSEETKKMQIKLDLNFPIKETPMPICNKILSPEQPVYRCYDCMTHQASVLCRRCFENADHKGHRYSQISSGGGNCDCGNPDAIRPIGFCVHHPGKAEPVDVKPQERQDFLEKTLMLFEWTFRLYEKGRSKSSDMLGQIVSEFLNKVNEKSLYYNTLTYHLLMSKRKYGLTPEQRSQRILDKIFQHGVKLINFARKITDVFLNMFSLEIFKYELTGAYTLAYNKYSYFQASKFKSLYIQLYANNDILQRLLVEKQLVLYPQSQYEYSEYIENLMFLSTIKPQVASKFFILLNQKGIVRIPLMDEIQKKVQTNGQHIVSIINQNLNIENFYYLLMQNFIKLIQNCQPSIILMLQNYTGAIMSEQFSYKKNKVIMPFHKILSIILLSIYQGQTQKINAQQIEKLLQGKYEVKDVFLRVFKMLLECFSQFSKTLFQTSYFDNYIPLYVKSGNIIVKFDLLMFSICIQIIDQLHLQEQMNGILCEIFNLPKEVQKKSKPQQTLDSFQKSFVQKIQAQQAQNDEDYESISSQSETGSLQTLRKLKINIQLLKIIIQSCISNRSEIVIANSIKIDNPIIKQRTQKLFIEVMNNFKQITGDNLKQINKNFIESKNIQQDLIKKFLIFDKSKKKYTMNQVKNEKISDKKFPLFLCSSIKKYGGIFAQKKTQSLENLLMCLQIPKEKLQNLKFILNQKFISAVTKQFIDKLTLLKSQGNKQIDKVFLDFVQVIRTLQYLLKEQAPVVITNFFDKLLQLSEKQEFAFLNEQAHKKITLEDKQQKKQSAKLKFEEMKKKKLQRMKQMQSTYDTLLEEQNIQEQKNESLCIICKQDKPGLCFLANFNYSNALQALMKVDGRFLVFNSCFHPIHISCFINASKHESMPCPLCKTQSNVMLPFQKQISNIKTINEIYERIITLRVSFRQLYSGYDKQFEQYGVISIFRSLTSIIGKMILQGQSILNNKDQRLANVLYNMTKNLAQSHFNRYRTQKETDALKKFLQQLKKKILNQQQQNNFYVLEYVALKIFYLCFIHKSQQSLQILKQPYVALLNKNDLKKIWDMCGQIVTLPLFKGTQQTKFQPKQLYKKISFYSPPEDVFQLMKIRDEASTLCKNGHQICICIMCQQKSCLDCRQTLRHSSKVHCGECISFNFLTGGLEYYMDTRVVHFPSLYENEMGFEWKPSKSPQGFVLDRQSYETLKKEIVNDSILKYLNGKYPQSFKKSLFFEMNIF